MVKNKRTKAIQKEIENVISPVTFKGTQAVIKNIPTKKTAGPDSLIKELYQILKEEIMTDWHKTWQGIRGKKRTF